MVSGEGVAHPFARRVPETSVCETPPLNLDLHVMKPFSRVPLTSAQETLASGSLLSVGPPAPSP